MRNRIYSHIKQHAAIIIAMRMLNAIFAEETHGETTDGNTYVSENCMQDPSRTYVMVQFIGYEETGTIVIAIIRAVEPPEETPQKGSFGKASG